MQMMLSSAYAFFAVTAAGCLLAAASGESARVGTDRLSALTLAALAATLAAAAAVVGQFGRPSLLFSVFSNPGTAIFRELASLLLALVAGVAYFAVLWTGAKRRTGRIVSICAALSGLLLALALGSSTVQPWRPVWNTWTLVLPAAGFAALSGAAITMMLAASEYRRERADGPAMRAILTAENKAEGKPEGMAARFRTILLAAASAPIAGLVLYFVAVSSDAAARSVLVSLWTGDRACLFWAGVVAPSVLPALLVALRMPNGLNRRPMIGLMVALLAALAAGAWQHLVLGLA